MELKVRIGGLREGKVSTAPKTINMRAILPEKILQR
jgi:hypothetical protein